MYFSALIEYAIKAQLDFAYKLNSSSALSSQTLQTEDDFEFKNSWTDSREVEENDVFIAIVGANNDGHDFIRNVSKKAALIIAENNKNNAFSDLECPILFVENTEKSLMLLAKSKRMAFTGKVIGITGSAGKTTVKECLAQILASTGKVAKNHKNYNTQIGLSLSILNTENDEDFWVLEAGISHEHDMDEIADILRPDLALVLNAGLAHAEGLPKGAAYYKSKLFSYLKDENSIAIASIDYPDLEQEAKKHNNSVHFYSILNKKSDYYSQFIKKEGNLGLFEIINKNKISQVKAPFYGEYGAENVLALSLLAHFCNMKDEQIATAFEKIELPAQRFEIHHIDSITLIDDSYNANPLSFQRMLEAAFEHTKDDNSNKIKPLICIIGSMGELGDIASNAHYTLGIQTAKIADNIYYTGSYQEEFKQGLIDASYTNSFSLLTNIENFVENLERLSLQHAVFLVKGSRIHSLEKYSQAIKNHYGANHVL